jgi:hypothetical protein
MRTPAWLFGWVLLNAALFGGLVLQGADAGPQLAPHETLPSLRVGGDGAARMAPVFVWGAALMFAQVGFLATAFALGFGAERLSRGGVVGAAVVHAAAVAALLISTQRFVLAPEASWLGPFPTPTSILVFVLWPAPLVYLWLFLRHFDAWMPSAKSEARLEALRRAAAENEAPTS